MVPHRIMVSISVIVPVFRSAGVIGGLVERLIAVLSSVTPQFEIILVDDGSPDESWKGICELRERYPQHIVGVQLMRNFGQHNALMCGFRHALGRYIVTLDDDGQNPPEEIPNLVDTIENAEQDVVYGNPIGRKQKRWRNIGSALVRAFYRLVFRSKVEPSSFRIIRREVIESILTYNLNFTYIDGLLAWTTQRIGEVEVEHQHRRKGLSGYSVGKLLTLAFNLFTNFSLLPLQIISLVGFVVALGGFLGGFYYMMLYLFSQIEVPGYASTIVAILVLGGTQLLALGVIGEYLGRLHLNVNRKPQYVEREVLDKSSHPTVGSINLGEQASTLKRVPVE